MTLASLPCLFMSFGALAMSPMIFTSQKALEDPQSWLLIGALVAVFLLMLGLLALMWLSFAFKWRKLAFASSLHPLLFATFYIVFLGGWRPNMDDSFDLPSELMVDQIHFNLTFHLHAPNLDPATDLHVYTHRKMDTTGEFGVPMRHLGDGDWAVTMSLPSMNYLYMYNLGDWFHQATHPDGTPRHNTPLELNRDTTIGDTIYEWLDQAPPARHLSPLTFSHPRPQEGRFEEVQEQEASPSELSP